MFSANSQRKRMNNNGPTDTSTKKTKNRKSKGQNLTSKMLKNLGGKGTRHCRGSCWKL